MSWSVVTLSGRCLRAARVTSPCETGPWETGRLVPNFTLQTPQAGKKEQLVVHTYFLYDGNDEASFPWPVAHTKTFKVPACRKFPSPGLPAWSPLQVQLGGFFRQPLKGSVVPDMEQTTVFGGNFVGLSWTYRGIVRVIFGGEPRGFHPVCAADCGARGQARRPVTETVDPASCPGDQPSLYSALLHRPAL
ncbi:hypothetical protein Bbelb_185000 [Branchiostoma belcheri]|nr:hypothetical protein Bbelb_185000 [Branchiostoma belcheri]